MYTLSSSKPDPVRTPAGTDWHTDCALMGNPSPTHMYCSHSQAHTVLCGLWRFLIDCCGYCRRCYAGTNACITGGACAPSQVKHVLSAEGQAKKARARAQRHLEAATRAKPKYDEMIQQQARELAFVERLHQKYEQLVDRLLEEQKLLQMDMDGNPWDLTLGMVHDSKERHLKRKLLWHIGAAPEPDEQVCGGVGCVVYVVWRAECPVTKMAKAGMSCTRENTKRVGLDT